MRNLAFPIAAMMLAVPGHAAEKPPRVLSPSTPWTVDFAAERCSMVRMFGTGKLETRLQIDAYGPGVYYRVLVAGDTVPGAANPKTSVTYSLSPDTVERPRVVAAHGRIVAANGRAEGPKSISFLANFTAEPGEMAVPADAWTNPTPELISSYRQLSSQFRSRIESLTIDFAKGAPIEFRTGNMKKALETMDTCVDGLISSWGIDAARYRGQSRTASPIPDQTKAYWERYPRSMVNNGFSAFVPARVMVDENGSVTGCVVQVPDVQLAFINSVCRRLWVKYEPALDAEGKPMASFVQTNVTYILDN